MIAVINAFQPPFGKFYLFAITRNETVYRGNNRQSNRNLKTAYNALKQ